MMAEVKLCISYKIQKLLKVVRSKLEFLRILINKYMGFQCQLSMNLIAFMENFNLAG